MVEKLLLLNPSTTVNVNDSIRYSFSSSDGSNSSGSTYITDYKRGVGGTAKFFLDTAGNLTFAYSAVTYESYKFTISKSGEAIYAVPDETGTFLIVDDSQHYSPPVPPTFVTANSYLDESSVGHIALHSKTKWTSTSYRVSVYFDKKFYDSFTTSNRPSYVGNGVLTDGDLTLTVNINKPPRLLLLEVIGVDGSGNTIAIFSKFFQFYDEYTISRQLFYDEIGLYTLNPIPQPFVVQDLFKARLYIGDNCVGLAVGHPVDVFDGLSTSYNLLYSRMPFGGVIFDHVFITEGIAAGTVIEFKMDLKGEEFSDVLVWSGSDFNSKPFSIYMSQAVT